MTEDLELHLHVHVSVPDFRTQLVCDRGVYRTRFPYYFINTCTSHVSEIYQPELMF